MISDSDMPSSSSGENRRDRTKSSSIAAVGKPSTSTGAERREAARHAITQFVWFKVIEEDPDKTKESQEGISKMCDISETGVGLYTTTPIGVGKTAFVEIRMGDFNISGVGQVAYSRKADERYYRIGIRLTIVPPNDRFLLGQFIEAKRKK